MSIYGTFYRRIAWPLYEQVRQRHTHQFNRQVERNQNLSSDELRKQQREELQKLLNHATTHCPWYATRFKQASLNPQSPRVLEDFLHLQPITKTDINANRNAMRANNLQHDVYEHCTGGSTGMPLRFYINRESYEWRLAVTMRGYGWAGCRDGDRQFYVWGAPIGTPPRLKRIKTCLHNTVLRRRMFSSFEFSKSAMTRCADEIRRFRPLTVIGYTNSLCLLAQHILEQKLSVPSPNAVITAAEGVNSVQRELLQQAFGAPVFVSYGSREFMLIGMECEQHNGLHLSVDNLLIEVVRADGTPAADGEAGEIILTDLHNYAMPFIRYKIGDMGVATSRACPCGRGLPLLERVEGRVLDVIRTPDGRILPGEFFPHLMKEFSAIKQFQVIQKELRSLEIKLVLRETPATEQLERLRQEVQKALGNTIQTKYIIVTEIPQTASGKFRVTVSELPQA